MRALQWVYDVAHKHKVAITPEMVEESPAFMFASGKQAMMQYHYHAISIVEAVGDRFEIKTCPFPYSPDTDGRDNRNSYLRAGLMAIYNGSEVKEETYEFLRYLCGYEAAWYRITHDFTPCPRPDIWEDPKMMEDPRHRMFIEYNASENAHMTGQPANLRTEEIYAAASAALSPIVLGEQTPEEAIGEIRETLQTILDKPQP
jgi:ABC-type glycerol-3-phosphate transport system substrate-binding protein